MVRPLLAVLAFCVACSTASAAPFGASDTAFSGDGWLTLSGGHDYSAQAFAVELQADRKIISGGTATVGGVAQFALTRHTPASGIDTTFGEQGEVVTPMGNSGSASIVDLDTAGGTILALGNARQDNEPRIALARYTPTGTLDGGFGTGGRVIDDLLADGATATAMARAADGSILVTGQVRDGAAQKVFLRRFTAAGTPDLLRTYALGDTGCATASRIFARPDGSIVVIGSLCRSTGIGGATYGPDGYVLKLTADGLRRGDFGTNGVAASTIPDARFTGGIVDSQGRFVLYGGGRQFSFGSYVTATAIGRLTADGAPDPSFGGGDGLTVIAGQDILLATDADELADGRLWITATASVGSAPILGAWGTALLNANGSPVTEYGFQGDGSRADQIGQGQTVNSEAPGESLIDTDQTLVTAGRASTTIFGGFLTENRTFGLRRFSLPKGNAVAPYNGYSGSSTAIGQTTTAIARRLRPLSDGGVIAIGDVVEDRNLRFTAWKLGADGAPDAGWGTNGAANPVIGGTYSRGNDIAPATGGGYYAVGAATDTDGLEAPAVVKLTASGALDASFSGDGILLLRMRPTSGDGSAPVCTSTPPLCSDNDGAAGSGGDASLAIPLADGGVLVLGTAGAAGGIRGGSAASRVFLARYTAAGLPVAGFGVNGLIQLYRNGIPTGNMRINTAILRGSDKVLAAGVLADGFGIGPISELQFNLATGALDPAFSDDGFVDATAPANYHRTAMRFAGATDTLLVSGYVSSPYPTIVGRFSGVLNGGFATPAITGTSAFSAVGVDLLPSGTLVAAVGVTDRAPRTASAIGVNPDGTLTQDFGTGGLLSTARSCGNFTTTDLSVDATGRLLLAGSGPDPALGNVASLARFVAGSPSAPVPCPPTSGSASISGPDAGPLTCTPSSFSGATPLAYTYEWVRESATIPGATAATHAVTAEDAGHLLACRVRGANAYGSYRAISAGRRAPGTIFVEPEPTATPTPEPPAGTGAGRLTGPAGRGRRARGQAHHEAPGDQALRGLHPAVEQAVRFAAELPDRLKAPKGVKLASATVRVNGKLVKTVKGKRLTAPVDLRGLPKGSFTVKVEAKTTDGRVVRDTRKYRTCVARGK